MRDASSAERAVRAASASQHRATERGLLDVPVKTRAAMVALGFIPLLHVLAAITPVALAAVGWTSWRAAWLAPAVLFLLPPMAVRVSTWVRPIAAGRIQPDSSAFLHWWFTAQCQVVFVRLPFLEELIRLVPGLYSAWLRLWGSEIGSLVYWSPGVAVLDRPLLRAGSRVVFGVGARLNAHVLAPDARGRATLHVAPITIGDDVLVGGYSLLLPGCVIAGGETTPPFRSIHAFSRFEGGRRSGASTGPAGEAEP